MPDGCLQCAILDNSANKNKNYARWSVAYRAQKTSTAVARFQYVKPFPFSILLLQNISIRWSLCCSVRFPLQTSRPAWRLVWRLRTHHVKHERFLRHIWPTNFDSQNWPDLSSEDFVLVLQDAVSRVLNSLALDLFVVVVCQVTRPPKFPFKIVITWWEDMLLSKLEHKTRSIQSFF